MKPELVLPDDFDEDAWLIECKGYFVAPVKLGEQEVEVTFYDPVRLAQDIAGEVGQTGIFIEERLVVVPLVTSEDMRAAAERVPASFFE